MNCEGFENVVVELARTQPLQAGVRDAALAHCSICDSCAQRLDEEKALSVGLHALSAEMKTAGVPEHLEWNLISAFRQQRFAPQSTDVNRWRYLAIAAAVIIAVTLAIAVSRMREPRESTSQLVALPNQVSPGVDVTRPHPTAPSDEQRINNSQINTRARQVVARHRPKKRRPSVSVSPTFVSVVVGSLTDSDSQEVASTFMPLSYTNTANFQEGAQVMRVELPRYAMARFGLPVNMERYDERVKADVWIGADGMARAIRFVQ